MDVPCSIQGNIHAFSLIINVSRILGHISGGSFLVYLSFCLTSGVELGLTSCEVEFAIAEMACVSRNVRRTFHVPFLLFQILRTVKDFPTFHF